MHGWAWRKEQSKLKEGRETSKHTTMDHRFQMYAPRESLITNMGYNFTLCFFKMQHLCITLGAMAYAVCVRQIGA